MLYKSTIIIASWIGVGIIGSGFIAGTTEVLMEPDASPVTRSVSAATVSLVDKAILATVFKGETDSPDETVIESESETATLPEEKTSPDKGGVYKVPFFSQFTDISAPQWQKVGCGIASLAMLIEYYEPDSVTVDDLLQQGIEAHAFLDDAGWTHAGLINLSHQYGLTGESHSLAENSMDDAFAVLEDELKEGPVMASVHYTFDPANPIPHLVVVNGVRDGKVYYNDPSESGGGGTISIAKFQSSWKKRYIDIRPVS